MKKVLSLVLAVSMCLSLCVFLTSCMGNKNPYQEYLIKHGSGRDYPITSESGEYPMESVTSYYKINGELSVGTDGRFYIYADETEIAPISNDEGTEDHRTVIRVSVSYDMRDTVLAVYLKSYSYSCNSHMDDDGSGYEWTDGFAFSSATKEDSTLPLTKFEFDINKYFENGKLTAEDAIQPLKLDASYLIEDIEGIDMTADVIGTDTAKYTERNPDWEADAISDIIDLVNDLLKEIDKVVAEKN